MTHIPSKRLPRALARSVAGAAPRSGVVLAAVAGLVAAHGLGAVGEAKAAAPSSPAPASAAPRWSDRPHGFASLAGGTTGGAGPYRLDPAAAVPALVSRFSGPQKQLGDVHTVADHLRGTDGRAPSGHR
ncbi:hypothetical protein [Streptomyces griseosporeus]|uniref:hypothetical protein n=1 Tax=Streptomyces griseosporeus TaxID=1910 RepID=UPI00167E60BE|nr:hypothetical protein [Streptomyces griseosporeus]GHF88403.1 hypothetical protein GCM10018783_68650 [Streptomyces griseosporeus]